MNILHLISSSGFYGAEKVLVELSKAAAKAPGAGKTFAGILRNDSNPHVEICGALRRSGVECVIFNCRGKFDIGAMRAVRSFIKAQNIEVLHSHGYKSNLYALCASLFLKVKRITTVHNWIRSDAKLRLYSLIDKFLLRGFDRIAVVSAALLDEVLSFGITPEKIRLISNGIKVEGDAPNISGLKASLGIPPRVSIVGTLGRLSAEKGHTFFIKAAIEALKEYPDTYFVLVGDGPLKEQYIADVKAAGVSKNFVFTGTRTDVHALLSMMDIFVLPSLMEGMPMALLEAMAAGRPVIATRVGAVPSILEGSHSGILVEPGDSTALAQKICMLLRDGELSRSIAKEALYEVSKNYSAKAMFAQYAKIYS
jgi:glycosyltransferase involved in cell wall biosynthesis